MEFKNSIAVWQDFGRDITDAARRQLGTRTIGKNKSYGEATGNLRRSLKFTLNEQTLTLSFGAAAPADSYANFLNYGVNGTEVNRGAPYSFGQKQPPRAAVLAWMKAKPVRLRDPDTGSFIKQTPARMNSAAFLIARAIKRKGIQGLFYFQRGYEAISSDYDMLIMEALALDIQDDMAAKIKPDDQ